MIKVFDKDNLKETLNKKPIICYYSENGACGPSGLFFVIFSDGDCYAYSTLYKESDKELIRHILEHVPELRQLVHVSGDINPLRERSNDTYESIYLGLGNYGLLREDYALNLDKYEGDYVFTRFGNMVNEYIKKDTFDIFNLVKNKIRGVDMKIYLGDRNKESIYIELGDLNNVLISGGIGGGKTVYFSRLIKELTSKYSPNEIKFVIHDSKSVDYFKFKDSPYLLFPITNDDKIEEFKSQLNELKNRQDTTPVIVLIDEFELISYKFKDCVKDIIELVKSSNEKKIYFFISSQSPSSFDKELKSVISNRICYWMINEKESKAFIGVTDGVNLKPGGEVIALINGKVNILQQTLFDGKFYL